MGEAGLLAAINSCAISDNVGEHPLPLKQSTAFPVGLSLAETAAVCFLLVLNLTLEQVLGTSILQLTRHCVVCSHLRVTPGFCVLSNWSMFY